MSVQTYPERYMEAAGHKVRIFSRMEFLTRRWNYAPGQHVVFVAPSQDGKTTLAFQLLMHTAKPTLPVYVLVMKPRDETPATWGDYLGYREVPTWPPPPRKHDEPKRPAGWLVWPPHTFMVGVDNAVLQRVFSRVLGHAYGHGDCIVFADEIYGLIAELRKDPVTSKIAGTMEEQINAILMRGSSMGCGLWSAAQKASGTSGRGLTTFLWSNATHLFFSRDPHKAARDRYADIAGIDPDLTKAVVDKLAHWQFAYVRKSDANGGPYICVIDSQ